MNGEDIDAKATEDQKEIKSRLSELGKKLDSVNARRQDGQDSKGRSSAIGIAYRLTVELVVGLAVGGFLGWWIDQLLGTRVIFLVIFLLLGMAAGILNVFRAARMMQNSQEKSGSSDDKS